MLYLIKRIIKYNKKAPLNELFNGAFFVLQKTNVAKKKDKIGLS